VSRRVERGPRSKPASQLGARLARERARQCKSMNDLARIPGIHASEISRLERGLRDPRLSTIVRIARALDVPVALLVEGLGAAPHMGRD
jgi:HTH-type transcriptional regulator, competence development regulator